MTEPIVAKPWHSFVVPRCVETERLVLRAYEHSDVPLLKAALDANLDHLVPWIPWATPEPTPLDAVEERIAGYVSQFRSGPNWAFAIFILGEPTLIGGIGFHARIGPRALEIGYWIDARATRRGYASEATSALTRMAFDFPEIDRLEIRCDPRNTASAAVPRRLGYRHVTTLEKPPVAPSGGPQETMVWELSRNDFMKSNSEISTT